MLPAGLILFRPALKQAMLLYYTYRLYSYGHMAAIQERVTAVLRSIPKEAFVDSFQKLYERFQKCVVKDGDYFEDQ
jgi:hypothetical protein